MVTSVDEDAEKWEPPYITNGNVKTVWLLWKTIWHFLKKLNVELSHDSAIPLLDIDSIEMKGEYTEYIWHLYKYIWI